MANDAEIVPGSRVLDVATGSGAVLHPAAALAGTTRSVMGIDLSPQMIRRAADEIRTRGLTNCTAVIGDAENLPFTDTSFDRVLCSFAIFLLTSLNGLLSEFHRVLTPSGKVGLAYSAGADQTWNWYEQLLSAYEPSASLGTERYDPPRVEATLEEVGFTRVASHVEVCHLVFADGPQWWEWAWSHGDRAVLESITGDRSAFKRRVFDEISRRASSHGLAYRVPGALTFATKRR